MTNLLCNVVCIIRFVNCKFLTIQTETLENRPHRLLNIHIHLRECERSGAKPSINDLLVSNPFDPLKFCEIKEICETSNDGIQVEMNSGFRFVCPNKTRGKTNQKIWRCENPSDSLWIFIHENSDDGIPKRNKSSMTKRFPYRNPRLECPEPFNNLPGNRGRKGNTTRREERRRTRRRRAGRDGAQYGRRY